LFAPFGRFGYRVPVPIYIILYHTLPQGPVMGLALTWLKETLSMDLNLGKIQLLNKKEHQPSIYN
jgi:hypothetical protein